MLFSWYLYFGMVISYFLSIFNFGVKNCDFVVFGIFIHDNINCVSVGWQKWTGGGRYSLFVFVCVLIFILCICDLYLYLIHICVSVGRQKWTDGGRCSLLDLTWAHHTTASNSHKDIKHRNKKYRNMKYRYMKYKNMKYRNTNKKGWNAVT